MSGKPEHFANDELTGHCVKHNEFFEGDRCLKCHPLKVLEKKEASKHPDSVTHDQVKESVQKVSKLRAKKNQLSEMCNEIRAIFDKRTQEPESITWAEIVGVLDMLKMECHQKWWLNDAIEDEVFLP